MIVSAENSSTQKYQDPLLKCYLFSSWVLDIDECWDMFFRDSLCSFIEFLLKIPLSHKSSQVINILKMCLRKSSSFYSENCHMSSICKNLKNQENPQSRLQIHFLQPIMRKGIFLGFLTFLQVQLLYRYCYFLQSRPASSSSSEHYPAWFLLFSSEHFVHLWFFCYHRMLDFFQLYLVQTW